MARFTVRLTNMHIHQVRLETALGDASGVQTDTALDLFQAVANHAAANDGLLTADFTDSGHDVFSLVLECDDRILQGRRNVARRKRSALTSE